MLKIFGEDELPESSSLDFFLRLVFFLDGNFLSSESDVDVEDLLSESSEAAFVWEQLSF